MKKEDISENGKLITGVGSALVDVLIQESDEFLEKTGGAKGGMSLVSPEKIKEITGMSDNKPAVVPGGSACNTIVGIASLGGRAGFFGKRGDDEMGLVFENGLVSSGVKPRLKISPTPTGCVLSVITPDAQRTMFTDLGASSELKPEEITEEIFEGASIVHIEGYILFNRDLIYAALNAAKKAGAKISLDLASFTVVDSASDIIHSLVKDYIDILLANEDEALAYTKEKNEQKSLEIMSEDCETAALKLGKRGSIIHSGNETANIGIVKGGEIVDTTGAGDMWAAGFLYGLTHGMDIEQSGSLGARCGYEVCRRIGADIPGEIWEDIKSSIG